MKLRINDDELSKVGASLSGAYAFFSLLGFALLVFVDHVTDFSNILNAALTIIFYIFVCSYFMKGKSTPYYFYVAILSLLISDYILPIIQFIILGTASAFTSGFSFSFILLPLGLITGLLYFIFLMLERKNPQKRNITALIVISIIMIVFGVFNAAFEIYKVVLALINAAEAFTDIMWLIGNDIMIVIDGITGLLGIGFALVYYMYAKILKSNNY